ncbi:hypothetical protein HDV00_006069 [Rhizophlyctis rosea]|nr:hypothetical protein HDV00_006069 [Rhizophlyctis rosea]
MEGFEEEPIVVISKIVSILIPEGHPTVKKEFFNLVVSGAERLGKSGVLALISLVANSTPMKELYKDVNIAVRTAIGTGPNTLGPELDLIEKFKRDVPSEFFQAHQINGRKFVEDIQAASSHSGWVFGDSAGKAKRILGVVGNEALTDAQGRKIKWILNIDEADHLFGRGLYLGDIMAQAERMLRETCELEDQLICVTAVSATALALLNNGPLRMLSKKYKVHTLKLKPTATYYGADRLEVSYPLFKEDKLLVGSGRTEYYNTIHKCLNAFVSEAKPRDFQDPESGKRYVVHRTALMATTTLVNVPTGQKEHADHLSTGKYLAHHYDENEGEWMPREEGAAGLLCVVYAGREPTIHDGGNGEVSGTKFLLEEYGDDPRVFGDLSKEPKRRIKRARRENSSGSSDDSSDPELSEEVEYGPSPRKRARARRIANYLQTFLPLLMRKQGLDRQLLVLGYTRLARALTVAFEIEKDGVKHVFYPAYGAFRILARNVYPMH